MGAWGSRTIAIDSTADPTSEVSLYRDLHVSRGVGQRVVGKGVGCLALLVLTLGGCWTADYAITR